MPKIIIMNNANEQMLGRKLNSQQAMFASKAALRNVWLASPGDIIVSTLVPSIEFMTYVVEIMSPTSKEISNFGIEFITPDTIDEPGIVLNDAFLLQPKLVAALRARIKHAQEWSVLSCYQTAGTARLQSMLGLSGVDGRAIGRNFAYQYGTDLLNRKSHFRQFATGAGLPLPEGEIVNNVDSLVRVVAELMPVTGKLIVKMDQGVSGTANFILTTSPTDALPGASQCITLPSAGGTETAAVLMQLWHTWQTTSPGSAVVEVYHMASDMFYLEFVINSTGQSQFLNSGTIRLRKHDNPESKELFWIGLELPAKLPHFAFAEAVLCCGRFLQLAAQMGYRGHINIDAIITETGLLMFNESNARWGGGTVLHEVATRLIGPNFSSTHVASSFRDVHSPGFAHLLTLLEIGDISYNPATQEGVVVLACDDQYSHSFEALILAKNTDRVRAFERQLMDTLNSTNKAAA